MNYIVHLGIMVGIYLPLAYSQNLTLGFGGLISFCHAAFYGIGAYTYAILLVDAHVHPLVSLVAAVLMTTALAVPVAAASLKFRDDLFLFVTLGFQMIIFVILYNWIGLTRGPYGISGIPRPELFDLTLRTPLSYMMLVIVMNILLLPLLFALYKSPFGMILKTLRENETAAESLGINANFVYFQALIISAGFAALPGAFYAAYVTYIDPTSFTLKESIFLVAILLVGGSGNRKGPFVGVLIMLLMPELLRFLGMPDTIAHNMREIIYGALLIILMYARPQGIAGEYKVS